MDFVGGFYDIQAEMALVKELNDSCLEKIRNIDPSTIDINEMFERQLISNECARLSEAINEYMTGFNLTARRALNPGFPQRSIVDGGLEKSAAQFYFEKQTEFLKEQLAMKLASAHSLQQRIAKL